MCVLIYKPKKTKLNDVKILKQCWDSNPHGAGIAIVKDKSVEVVKGLMTFEEFLLAYNSLYDENKDIIIHFRLASKGNVTEKLTHPFLIDKTQPKNLKFKTKTPILFHNGTIFGIGSKDKSDTQEMSEILSEIPKTLWNKILKITGDKFIIAKPKEVIMIGNFHLHKGCYFSNMYWQIKYKHYLSYYDSCYINFNHTTNNNIDDIENLDK